MIQGGDPTGTGKGGESIWGGTIRDEFSLEHKYFFTIFFTSFYHSFYLNVYFV